MLFLLVQSGHSSQSLLSLTPPLLRVTPIVAFDLFFLVTPAFTLLWHVGGLQERLWRAILAFWEEELEGADPQRSAWGRALKHAREADYDGLKHALCSILWHRAPCSTLGRSTAAA